MTDKERIRRLELDLEVARLRLCGGVNATNVMVDLRPTVQETIYYAEMHYGRVLQALAKGPS